MAALLTNLGISIHAPREGGDRIPVSVPFIRLIFQSTPPARGATGKVVVMMVDAFNFNPRPPRGGRQSITGYNVWYTYISIHAPREGGDVNPDMTGKIQDNFNPRPPRGGRPEETSRGSAVGKISIHAPREGGDLTPFIKIFGKQAFQSTPPARGATLAFR
mgnify:CR=1 FL=1